MTVRLADTRSLLASLTRVFPPPIGVHHNVTFDASVDALLVTVFYGGRWHSARWTESDEGRPLSDVLAEVVAHVKAISQ